MKKLALVLLSSIFLTGCSTPAHTADQPAQEKTRQGMIEFTGTVVYVPIEGGFYGIVAEDGTQYDPKNLPGNMMRDGLKVRVQAQPVHGAVGFHMWGQIVEIINIDAP